MSNELISNRINELVNYFSKGNKSDFARAIGISEANIRNYIAGKLPKADTLFAIIDKFEINAEWLLTGQGEMLKQEEPQTSAAPPENDFAGLTNQQIKDLIREEFDAYLLEQFEAGRIVPAVTAKQYQDQIKELTAQVARLEYINQELTVKLQASGKPERAKRKDDAEQKKSL